VVYLYPQDMDMISRACELLDMPPSWSWEVITSNMRKAPSLTLWILKSLYLKADLGSADKGFAATCLEEEGADLVQSFFEIVNRVIEMS
jgi:hypothetical protein